jgi:hypothetical protein
LTGVSVSRRPVGSQAIIDDARAFGKYCSIATSAIGTIPVLAAVLSMWQILGQNPGV